MNLANLASFVFYIILDENQEHVPEKNRPKEEHRRKRWGVDHVSRPAFRCYLPPVGILLLILIGSKGFKLK